MKYEVIGINSKEDSIVTKDSIVTVYGLKKCKIQIYKDGFDIVEFSFNSLIKYGDLEIAFSYDFKSSVSVRSSLIKGKLRFSFESENCKFYKLEI